MNGLGVSNGLTTNKSLQIYCSKYMDRNEKSKPQNKGGSMMKYTRMSLAILITLRG